jgi:Ni,Fe-hydrogenase I small subunit
MSYQRLWIALAVVIIGSCAVLGGVGVRTSVDTHGVINIEVRMAGRRSQRIITIPTPQARQYRRNLTQACARPSLN